MSQASAGGGTGRAEMERSIVQRSMEDEEFRQRLLDDPKGTVEQELATQLPEDVEVSVVQESQQTIYLVLPFRSAVSRLASSQISSLRRWPVARALRLGPTVAPALIVAVKKKYVRHNA